MVICLFFFSSWFRVELTTFTEGDGSIMESSRDLFSFFFVLWFLNKKKFRNLWKNEQKHKENCR